MGYRREEGVAVSVSFSILFVLRMREKIKDGGWNRLREEMNDPALNLVLRRNAIGPKNLQETFGRIRYPVIDWRHPARLSWMWKGLSRWRQNDQKKY